MLSTAAVAALAWIAWSVVGQSQQATDLAKRQATNHSDQQDQLSSSVQTTSKHSKTTVISANMADTQRTQREMVLREAVQLRLEERADMIADRLQIDETERKKVFELLRQFTPDPTLLAQVEGLDTAEADAMRQLWSLQSHQSAANFEAALLNTINPQQQQKWRELQQERRQNQIESAAMTQLARLQQHLTLENEQKDEVYRILATQHAEQQSAPAELLLSDSYNDANATLQNEQLQHVLTPSQVAIYQSLPQQKTSVIPDPLFDFSDLSQ